MGCIKWPQAEACSAVVNREMDSFRPHLEAGTASLEAFLVAMLTFGLERYFSQLTNSESTLMGRGLDLPGGVSRATLAWAQSSMLWGELPLANAGSHIHNSET